MEEKMTSLKKTARVAGLLYLLMVLTSLYAHVYVPLQIFVKGDTVATTNNILANEFLFRTCIVVSLAGATIFLFLALSLYRLFREVSHPPYESHDSVSRYADSSCFCTWHTQTYCSYDFEK